jgi:succinate dehydrogenase/fumarate reductase cytochrome b subunit
MFSLGALLGWRDAKRGGLEMEDLGIFALFFDGIFVFFSDLGILSSWSFRLEREQEKRCNCKVFLLSVVFWYGFWFGVQNGGRV